MSHGKCWYSEAKDTCSYWQVDHFRPKSEVKDLDGNVYEGYWWLAFEWKNYILSGAAINAPKSSKFPVREGTVWANGPKDLLEDEYPHLLDPTRASDPGFLSFDESGRPRAADPNGKWSEARANESISILNLNFGGLVEERKDTWRRCQEEIEIAVDAYNKIQDHASVTNNERHDNSIVDLQRMVSREAPFSSTSRACVLSQGLEWLRNKVFS